MKRLPQTLTAAALTGALAFGGAAVAQAQETESEQFQNEDKFYENLAPRTDNYTTETEEAPASEDPAGSEDEEGTTPATEGEEETETAAPDTTDIPAPATKKDAEGNEWYQSLKDPAVYVNDPAKVNEEITDEMRDAYAKAFPSEDPKPGFDKKKLAWLALPAALVIGGITWYLSQDGKTYVKDEARKGQEPTAEEKAASEQMLNANKDEVVAQGGKLAEGDAAQAGAPAAPAAGEGTDSVRGMAAETGSNSVAQALAALAVAAMVAAGAFAARRKFFA
ncbi:hypothetical protein [Corynebacterium sp. ACRPQ]|uniref:hypothetical protein n=1 Tax=Corynebacterium sp. ACRPQ TaxID=2918201 RepID=UPI001EF3B273|nr:hypothetical protein [Corynebacterium sp. ACRPQ]MCG7441250.1 hypothetical protein [Corynebacterium sp. ACRPQ]